MRDGISSDSVEGSPSGAASGARDAGPEGMLDMLVIMSLIKLRRKLGEAHRGL